MSSLLTFHGLKNACHFDRYFYSILIIYHEITFNDKSNDI